jgi:endonuclease/exonuclease/phosphatase (EEP) superfamily protein YafD
MRLILDLANLFLRGTALMLCLVAAVVGVAGLGGAFSDRLDTLTHGAPLWLACGVLGLALAVAVSRDGERKALVGLAIAGILASSALMTPELLSTLHRPAKLAEGASTLKLVQFNLWNENHDADAAAAWLLKQHPDVLIGEETAGRASPVLRAIKAAYPYRTTCRAKYGCDTRIFSRWPIVDERSLHEKSDSMVGSWATIRHPGGDFTVVGNHFVWPIPAGHWQEQSRVLEARIAPFPKDSLIVAGDFNSTPWSWGLRRQDKAWVWSAAPAPWPAGPPESSPASPTRPSRSCRSITSMPARPGRRSRSSAAPAWARITGLSW